MKDDQKNGRRQRKIKIRNLRFGIIEITSTMLIRFICEYHSCNKPTKMLRNVTENEISKDY